MPIACISERAKRLDVPADLPVLRDRETLAQVLASFGTKFVREVSDPTVIKVFRLAIAEAVQAPEVARALNSRGRETSRAALRKIMARAQASGLLAGRPAELAEQFAGLLWRDLMVSLLLGVAERPNSREIAGTCPRRRSRLPATSSATEGLKNSIVICWVHFEFYRLLFDARATNSSNLESKSLRIGDWFAFL